MICRIKSFKETPNFNITMCAIVSLKTKCICHSLKKGKVFYTNSTKYIEIKLKKYINVTKSFKHKKNDKYIHKSRKLTGHL